MTPPGRDPRLGEYSKRRVAALVEVAWMVTPIFLRATMPQVQPPDTGEGSGCGRFGVLATQCAVLESKADMQKRGEASPDDGDALALTFAQPVAPAEVEERDDEEEFGRYGGSSNSGWMP
jgi:hypothetical protein